MATRLGKMTNPLREIERMVRMITAVKYLFETQSSRKPQKIDATQSKIEEIGVLSKRWGDMNSNRHGPILRTSPRKLGV
jgi:hypothetical protein